MTTYLRVKNLDKHQHYKDRRPPWIKLHAEVLDDYAFACLQDASKAHLMLIWSLASRMDNRIPNDPAWIGRKINATSPVDVDALVSAGFLERYGDASEALAPCKQSALVETETETEREAETAAPGAAVAAPDASLGGWAVSRVVDTIPLAVALTAPARPADRPAGEQPALFPSGAVRGQADATDVAPAEGKAKSARAGKPTPKYPHFPSDTRVALHVFWESKVGKLDMSIFVREMGPLFDRPRAPDELAEYVKRIQSALGLCVAVLSHRALEWKDRNSGYEWSAFRPAKFVARSVEWFKHEQQFRQDPSYLNALCDRPVYARSVA